MAPRRSLGCNFPPRVYKTHGSQLQRATIVLLYLCNMIIPLFEVPLSSSNIIKMEYAQLNKLTNSCLNKKHFFTVPSNPRMFRTIPLLEVLLPSSNKAFLLRVTNFTVCYRGITMMIVKASELIVGNDSRGQDDDDDWICIVKY